jgi:drug/metabolite transporter (DMT)-like permease
VVESEAVDGGRAAVPSTTSAQWLANRPWLGTGFVALTATSFATGSTVVRFTYDAGATTLAVVMVRTTFAAIVLGLLLVLLRVPLRLSPRERWAAPLLGVVIALYSTSMYRGLEYMPVALTIVTFYTYPLFTGLFGWVTGQERFGAAGIIALPLAFVGLILALDVSGGAFSAPGAAWTVLGALAFAAFLIISARLFPRSGDTRPRSFVMLAVASLTCMATALLTGDLSFPATAPGWSWLMASSVFYTLSMAAIILATAAFGASRVALVMNFEPISSLALTYFILGERLRPIQLAGAALVVAAIILFRPRRAGAGRPVKSV